MNRVFRAALTLLGGLMLVGAAHAAPPGPAAAGDPCAAAPCRIAGAAVQLTVPLPIKPGEFAGKFQLVPLFDHAACPKGAARGTECPVLNNGHAYQSLAFSISLRLGDGRVLTAPAGMATDLASIPRPLWSVLPPDGAYEEAATIHDDCYKTKGTFVWHWAASPKPDHPVKYFVGLPRGPPLTRAGCDEALRQGMVALAVPAWQRISIYGAVRAFGGVSGWGH